MKHLLQNPFLLAPIAGVTDSVFRQICFENGCGLSFTEMVSAKALVYDDKRTKELLLRYPGESLVGAQLFGSEPDVVAHAARRVAEMGFGLIDINMGCPTRKIVKSGEGGALMKNTALAARIVSETVKAAGVPVSVKMRLGWDKNEAAGFAKAMEEAGASMITLHGRTVLQQYSGNADWNAIADVAKAAIVPIIGNGDAHDAVSANALLSAGVSAVMIARGALGNPWIFSEAAALRNGERKAPPTGGERIAMAKRHALNAAELYGPRRAALIMRKHCAWYVKGLKNSAPVRQRLNECEDIGAVLAVLEKYGLELAEN